jgi:FkbM family methyltransferase
MNCEVEEYLTSIGYDVWCFDPTPDTAPIMVLPLERNTRLHFMPIAVGLIDGEEPFCQSRPGRALYTLEPGSYRGETITVRVLPIWTIMRMSGHAHIDLLKLDIEGTESEVLRQVLDAGVRPGVIMVEWHDAPGRANAAIRQQLEIIGYSEAASLKGHCTYVFDTPCSAG